MKIKKKIFTSLNLILFISSLLFSTFNSFTSNKSQSFSNHIKLEVNASQHTDGGNCSQLLCEKIETENETEHDLHVQAVILPFSITCFDLGVQEFSRVPAQPLAEKLSNPIYLSVCNFRV